MNKFWNFVRIIPYNIFKVLLVLTSVILACAIFVKYTAPKYGGPKYESDLYQRLDDFSTKYGKEHNCELIDIGDFSEPRKGLLFGIWLRCFSSENLNQGRKQAVTLVNDLWRLILYDPVSIIYFSEIKQRMKKFEFNTPKLQTVGVKIAYWDKNTNRPQKPFLAEIRFLDERFYYYQADPETQGLRLVHEESYEDAVKHLSQS